MPDEDYYEKLAANLMEQNKALTEKQLEDDFKMIQSQLLEMDPNTEGILVMTYGTKDYMVSGGAAHKIMKHVSPVIKDRHPGLTALLLPWYMKIEYLNVEEFLKRENT